MSLPLSIDVLPTIDALVDNNTSREQIISLGARQIRRLREDLRAGANASPEQQRKLGRLQAVIGTRIALVEAAGGVSDIARKEIVTELQTLREVMDKRFILPDYAPDAPDAVRKTLQFTAGSLDVGIRTLNAATRDLPTAARVGIFVGASVATVLAVKWLWNELGVIGKAVGTGIAGAAGFLGFQKLQENWTAIGGFFTNMRDKVRGWFGGGGTEQQEKIRKQQDATTKLIRDALDRNRTNDVNVAIGSARKAIQDELAMIDSVPGQEPRKTFLQGRLKALEAREAGLKKIENQTKNTEDKTKVENQTKNAEDKIKVENQTKNTEDKNKAQENSKTIEAGPRALEEQVTQALASLPEGINLFSPATEREIAGINVRMADGKIYLDGRPLIIEGGQDGVPGWLPVTLNWIKRTGTALEVSATVTILVMPYTPDPNPKFGAPVIVAALRRYQNGQLPHVEIEKDSNGKPTGKQSRLSV